MSEPLVLNVPCEAGKEIGEQLARFYVQEKCEQGADDNRCHDCAFRLGSYPNGCAATVAQALECLRSGEPFYCHHGMEDVIDPEFGADKRATRLCEGYKMLAVNNGETT